MVRDLSVENRVALVSFVAEEEGAERLGVDTFFGH